jgi:hypothetical protein
LNQSRLQEDFLSKRKYLNSALSFLQTLLELESNGDEGDNLLLSSLAAVLFSPLCDAALAGGIGIGGGRDAEKTRAQIEVVLKAIAEQVGGVSA